MVPLFNLQLRSGNAGVATRDSRCGELATGRVGGGIRLGERRRMFVMCGLAWQGAPARATSMFASSSLVRRSPRRDCADCRRTVAVRVRNARRVRCHSSGQESAVERRQYALARLWSLARIIGKYSRPHTVLGSVLSVLSVSLFALRYAPLVHASIGSVSLRVAALPILFAVICAVLVNVYITGLNQIFDVDVDRINKPTLPLASGELGIRAGWTIVLAALPACAGLAAAFPALVTRELLMTLAGSALLGTLYSAPPVRLKRFPLAASICILSVRGLLVNVGFFLSMFRLLLRRKGLAMPSYSSLWSSIAVSRPLLAYIVFFFTGFGVCIALFKDIPDIAGDAQFSLRSFAVRIGASKTLWLASGLLAALYIGFSSVLLFGHQTPNVAMATYHLMAAAWLLKETRDLVAASASAAQIYDFYMRVWGLFYLEYCALPWLL
ncbi:putative homogentisate phytyltransferase 1, chloroplastic [Porphyridium purpureum]|uniref:Putative homogentisate phytyltransferase 1, chloroplastic n=1 Tax=Porphyridium purpureum TaxID=35688 RepID=A0A5J4YQS7_PORPP|nr:putative homogentisate phytyltransferase 1, chloroplastic [Porphyridium purpureum]|eukprot:POR9203..scf222_8